MEKASEKQVGALVIAIRACFARLRSVADGCMPTSASPPLCAPSWRRCSTGKNRRCRRSLGTSACRARTSRSSPTHWRRSASSNLSKPITQAVVAGRPDRTRPLDLVEMRRRERAVLQAVAEALTPDAAEATLTTLVAMQRRLEKWKVNKPTGKEHSMSDNKQSFARRYAAPAAAAAAAYLVGAATSSGRGIRSRSTFSVRRSIAFRHAIAVEALVAAIGAAFGFAARIARGGSEKWGDGVSLRQIAVAQCERPQGALGRLAELRTPSEPRRSYCFSALANNSCT